MRTRLVAITLIVSCLAAGTSNAAVGTHTYAVTGSNFSSSSGTPPFASITESVTITFDTATLVSQATSGIVQNASTIVPSSTLAYTYVPVADQLVIGGLASTVATSDPASTDFALVINNASMSNFGITSLTYSSGTGSVFSAQTLAAATMPEPASLALVGCGLAIFGLVRRRR